ncbi:MAG: DUF2934 domain-containing protein [Acidobacteriota bacterium]|nr:DUF2934 domain-containing protein [Acidobacteriota bacterium]
MKQLYVNHVPVQERPGIAPGYFLPGQDKIAVLAYRLWKERGSPFGSPKEDWLRAQRQIKHDRTPGSVV